MKRELIIHIGTFKTGSTSIQKTLFASSQYLKKKEIFYSTKFSSSHSDSIIPIVKENANEFELLKRKGIITPGKLESYIQKCKEEWIEELELIYANSYESCIISGEGIARLTVSELRKLKEFLSKYFDRIKIIGYFLEPNSFFTRMIQQRIKGGTGSLNNIDRIIDNSYKYKNIIENFSGVFGENNIIVRPFKKESFYNGDLVQDFFYSLNFTNIDYNEIKYIRSNKSLGLWSVILLSHYNELAIKDSKNEFHVGEGTLSNKVIQNIFRGIDEPKFTIDVKYSKSQVKRINEQVNYINQFLEKADQFELVEQSQSCIRVPSFESIPVSYFTEFIRQVSLYVDKI
jgi:hypothetical protein